MSEIAQLRREYDNEPLDESTMADDPLVEFGRWFEAARQAVREPNAMTLATATADGRPSARVVLLKEVDARGFVFYTSHISDKAGQLADNPQASLVFWWEPLQRQVRVEGDVTRVDRASAQAYFASRPRPSQIGAWASHQSRTIGSRAELIERFEQFEREHEGRELPLPEFWGGYRVLPRVVEFWQGQASRLHDRVRYQQAPPGSQAAGGWVRQRLGP